MGDKATMSNGRVLYSLPEKTSLKIFRQITSALNYMHGLDLIHRDLKIENILLNPSTLEVKFTDFGFATCFKPNKSL